jgi:hypothetical protein
MNKVITLFVVLFSINSFAKRVQINCEDGPMQEPKFSFTFAENDGKEMVHISNPAFGMVVEAKVLQELSKNNPDISKLADVAFGSKETGIMSFATGNDLAYGRETVDITVMVPGKEEGAQPVVATFTDCYLAKQEAIGFR